MFRMFRSIIVSYVVYVVCADNFTKETVTDESSLSAFPGFKIENVFILTRENHSEESFKLSKREMEFQNVTDGNYFEMLVGLQQEHAKWHSESQAAIAENHALLNQSLKQVGDLVQQLSKMQSDLSKLREETTSMRATDTNRMQRLERNSDLIQRKVTTIERMQQGSFRSCKEIATKTSGLYNIRPSDTLPSFLAYCDQQYYGGGWMVIQRRREGILNFTRNWTDYRNGFGEPGGEVWIGLERLHQFTKVRPCELYIGLSDFSNNHKYALYNSFLIGNEAEGYNLKILGAYSGTAGDALTHHKGMKFSTADQDNDAHANANCAKTYHGGWWFNSCHLAFLNGLHRNVNGKENPMIGWFGFHNEWRGLRSTLMMIRPLK
ncbi:fibrinogen-like protein 1 [Anopheles albimanus]|uniref:fibrinogen-like protein 1 n=1 Tax=Anopheles albimanus TaxID=7167 RepID=UPI00163FB5E3|nr:fibrinogen-like protein 1 [Anopheles albimanus]